MKSFYYNYLFLYHILLVQVSGLQDEYSVPENMTLQICLNLTITNATYNGNYSINITTNPADAEGTGK